MNDGNVLTNDNAPAFGGMRTKNYLCRNNLMFNHSKRYRVQMLLEGIKKIMRGTAAYPGITLCVDLLFCLVILPLTILLVPVDKWFVTQPAFVVTLVIYLYLLYFVYRKVNIPSLFMRKRYGRIIMTVVTLLLVTELMTHFPLPENSHSKLPLDFRRHLHSQT